MASKRTFNRDDSCCDTLFVVRLSEAKCSGLQYSFILQGMPCNDLRLSIFNMHVVSLSRSNRYNTHV